MRLLISFLFVAAQAAAAQSGGFVTTLGADTVQIERFTRSGNELSGVVVTRAPVVRILRWTMTVDGSGRPLTYDASAVDAQGAPVQTGVSGRIVYANDTLTKTGWSKDGQQTTRAPLPSGAVFPGPSLPYIGVSNLMYEMALTDARRRAAGGDTSIYLITMIAMQSKPQRTRAWVVSADSMEIDYFNVARSGYAFDAQGRLLRADWRNTTYRYRIARVEAPDIDAFAARWSNEEKSGKGFGPLSPRDSVFGRIGSAALTIDYSRPAKRGRDVWGDVVRFDQVWRLGADMATHFTTSTDLNIGGTLIPAGRYTLWMIASATAPVLIVSKAVNVFGTNYDPSRDLARIPLSRAHAASVAERLTLSFDPDSLSIHWDDVIWSVAVKPPSAIFAPVSGIK